MCGTPRGSNSTRTGAATELAMAPERRGRGRRQNHHTAASAAASTMAIAMLRSLRRREELVSVIGGGTFNDNVRQSTG